MGLTIFDEVGNPLPPGIRVTVNDPTGALIGQQYVQVGGNVAIPVQNGASYTASFRGTQGPSAPASFVGGASASTAIVLSGYRSPALGQTGYLIEEIALWPVRWFGDEDVTAPIYYPELAVGNAFAGMLAALDTQIQSALALTRVQGDLGNDIDSWVADFLGAGVFPRAPSEIDSSYLSRVYTRLSLKLGTLACIQTIVNEFLQLFVSLAALRSPLALDTGGALDVIGALNGAAQTTATAPSALVFDAQSNPALAAAVGLQIGQFCILFGNAALSPLPEWFLSASYLGVNTYLGGATQYEIVSAPSPLLDALVRSVKAEGTMPVYATLAPM